MPQLPLTSAPESLCILRLSAIGDVTHLLPVIATLQKTWPQTKLTWIIGKLEYQLVKSLPDIEFIIFDKSQGWSEYRALRTQLASRKFDVLLMMQVALRANMIATLIPARLKVGYDQARSRDLHALFRNRSISGPSRIHVLDTFFQFIEKLGIQAREMNWLLKAGAESSDWVKSLLNGKPTIAINPCSSARKNNWRNWPEAYYAKVIDFITDNQGVQVVLTGGPSDEEIAFSERIIQQTNSEVINLVGKTSLDQLLAVLEQSQCLIAPDTGPAHMGTVAGIPVIGLYASSNPKRTGPYKSQDILVNAYPEALQHFSQKSEMEARWGERVRNPKVMQLITPQMVIERLKKLAVSGKPNKTPQA